MEGRAPVLIDFGLARLAEDPRLTATGWLLGTPGYLAPEILYGDDATTASDVHSGPRRWCSPRPAARRSAPARRWRSWTGSAAASTTCPTCRPALLPLVQRLPGPRPRRPPRDRGGARVPAGAGARRPHAALRARRARARTARRARTPLTVPLTRRGTRARPTTAPSVLQPARAPYMQPPAPQQPPRAGRRAAAPGAAGRLAAGAGRAATAAARRPAARAVHRRDRSASRGRRTSPWLVAALARARRAHRLLDDRVRARERQHLRGRRAGTTRPLTAGVLAVVPRRRHRRHARCCCSGRRSSRSWSASPT